MPAISKLCRIAARTLIALSLLGLPTLAAAADILTNPGANQQWTVPPGVTSIDVEVWGAGGAGGGNNTTSDGGGGGGGGAYSKVTGIAVAPGSQLTYTIGLGGVGVAGSTGGNGGDSWFISTATVLAKGGSGGAAPVAGAGGVGGTGGAAAAGVGTVKFSGGNGGAGRNNRTGQGGPGGSSAGTAANGTSGTTPWSTITAAAAPTGGGIGGNGGTSRANGLAPASGNGGGGGGSGDAGRNGTVIGGDGSSGKIIISYVSAPLVTTDPASAFTATGATLNGTVTSNGASTTVTFEYGLTTAYGDTATAAQSPLAATAANTPVSAAITGLSCNTTYHYRAVGSNASGTTNGDDATFTTGACVVTATPTACTNVTGIGSVAWTIPGNPLTPAATASLNRTLPISNFLVCTGYNFNIPSTATIDGIIVGVSRYNAGRGTISDAAMRLVDATSTIGTTDRSTATAYPTQTTVGTLENHGTATDLWGATWTPTDINSANFGAAFAAQYTGTRTNAHVVGVDGMPITIYYTPSANTAPDHLEIQHPSGTGVTCAPSTLTIKACADAACTVAYTNGVGGTLGATGSATVNWWNGTSFSIPAGSSTTTKDVQITTPGSVVFDAATTPVAASATTCNFGTPSCTFTVADSGFLASVPNHAAETSTTLTLQAVKKADNSLACVPAFANASKTVNLQCAYSNPTSGTLPVRIAGTALNATANAAAACDGTGANIALAFDANGIATPTLQYADVGQMSVSASFTGAAGTPDAGLSMSGSAAFIAAPASFSFSAITAAPIKAGNNFSATVTALNLLGATTPNFGQETAAESATLSFTKCEPTGAGAVNGTFTGSVGAFTAGAANASNLNWSEVGNGDLIASLASGSYLGSGLSATGNTGSGGTTCNTAGNVGPFIPDHFDTVVTDGCAGCGFTYSGQPFTVEITAMNGLPTPTVTTNYDGSANTTPNFANGVTLSDANASTSGALGVSNTPMGVTVVGNNLLVPVADFIAGKATLTSVPTYTFSTQATAPTIIKLRAVDVVNASVTSATFTEGTTEIRSGRVTVPNGYGSELLPLTLAATVQYYDGTSWTTSTTDSATALGLAASYPVGTGSTTPSPAGGGTVSNGVLNITLSAPGAGVTGNATIAPTADTYLPVTSGQATFGVYKSNAPLIYMREN